MVLVSLSPLRLEETSAKLWYSESILAIAFFNCGCLLLFFFQLVASTHACYSSVLSCQNKLYLLGLKVLHIIIVICVWSTSLK